LTWHDWIKCGGRANLYYVSAILTLTLMLSAFWNIADDICVQVSRKSLDGIVMNE